MKTEFDRQTLILSRFKKIRSIFDSLEHAQSLSVGTKEPRQSSQSNYFNPCFIFGEVAAKKQCGFSSEDVFFGIALRVPLAAQIKRFWCVTTTAVFIKVTHLGYSK